MALKTYTQAEMREILDAHKEWLGDYSKGRCADLREADLHGADLHGAYLSGANLRGANLYGADLREADLHGADLHGADLHGADLYRANLHGAYLREADLRGADLSGADLRGACLREADLRGADLSGADLRGACLSGANLHGAKIQYEIVPSEGSFVGWKKVQAGVMSFVLKLQIPAKAARTSNYRSRKNRAEFVKTLAAYTVAGEPITDIKEFVALHDSKTVYAVGKVTRPDSYNGDPREECTNGIHFFVTQQEAAEYV